MWKASTAHWEPEESFPVINHIMVPIFQLQGWSSFSTAFLLVATHWRSLLPWAENWDSSWNLICWSADRLSRCYGTTLFLGRCYTYVYSLQIGSMTHQGMDVTKAHLDEIMSFVGVNYKSIGEGLLTETEMTQRRLYHQSPPWQGWQLSPAGNLEQTAQPVYNSTN